ncbi:phosphatidate cytidylyltransferase, partial [Micromonospora aurantiaca]|nr:phosphatidate cytidylyltransferase [Micromonospora aurantiaca]
MSHPDPYGNTESRGWDRPAAPALPWPDTDLEPGPWRPGPAAHTRPAEPDTYARPGAGPDPYAGPDTYAAPDTYAGPYPTTSRHHDGPGRYDGPPGGDRARPDGPEHDGPWG